ncbi:hypothetical protein EG329_001863 [Mollisiaceae sp. DMI_Dod_QoI]|nr:hypothetical protein EG329_001863 [Helotiales sp. DMI_Dod_QoI]
MCIPIAVTYLTSGWKQMLLPPQPSQRLPNMTMATTYIQPPIPHPQESPILTPRQKRRRLEKAIMKTGFEGEIIIHHPDPDEEVTQHAHHEKNPNTSSHWGDNDNDNDRPMESGPKDAHFLEQRDTTYPPPALESQVKPVQMIRRSGCWKRTA